MEYYLFFYKNNIFIKILKIFIFFYLIKIINYKGINLPNNIGDNNLIVFSEYSLVNDAKNIINQTNIYFKIINYKYEFSFEYNIMTIMYEIIFYNKNNSLIKPSVLTLNNQLHILCHIYDKNRRIMIDSIANIKENKYFYCIEFVKIKQTIKFGIKIYRIQDNIEFNNIYFFSNRIINYNNFEFNKDYKFNLLINNKNFYKLLNNIKNDELKNNNHFRLKKSYLSPPFYFLKIDIAINENQWHFNNIYNNYFCFCKGKICLEKLSVFQNCKYKFYLTIIDKNRDIYKKTNYLLADFILKDIEPIDGYPIFKEMIKQNLAAYYMTGDEKIYKYFYNNKYLNLSTFPIIYETKINGDFLEKYLEILLRLKVVVGVDSFYSMDNLFYNIEYITYIFLGHGVSYFKQYLYENYLSYNKFDQIVIPPSTLIISIAIKYGWKDRNIIKLCLPRWDNYNTKRKDFSSINKKLSIFLMFTWRNIKIGKYLSPFYINNLFNLLNNKQMNKKLKEKNITLFYTYHHALKGNKKLIFNNNKNIKLIDQSLISECLKNSSLLITDFSSIVFDYIYQKKPFILYIPDANDPMIENIYIKPYFEIINGLKNGSFYFENKFFDLQRVIDKTIFYINNNFKIDKILQNFFKYFNFEIKSKNHTISLINYLKKLD